MAPTWRFSIEIPIDWPTWPAGESLSNRTFKRLQPSTRSSKQRETPKHWIRFLRLMAEEHPRRLWVYWKQPKVTPDPSCLILTFLSPSAEQRLKLQHPGEVLFGREASLTVRKQARDAYLGVAARLAAVPAVKGKTLRELLASPGQSTLWWYHRVSAKDCEADPTFDRIIALFTIVKVAGDRGIREIVLVGAPAEFPATLGQKFR